MSAFPRYCGRPVLGLFLPSLWVAICLLLVAAPVSAGPLLYYSFESPDDVLDDTVTDNSGNGRDGTLQASGNGAYAYVGDAPTGIGGSQSLELTENGRSNAAKLERTIEATELDFSNQDWTWSSWFKRRDSESIDMIFHVGSGDGFGGENEIYVYGDGTNVIAQHYPGNDVNLSTSASTGIWYHAALVHDATAQEVRFYVNGQQVSGSADSAANFAMEQNPPPVLFGAQSHGTDERNLDGWLDDVALWDAAVPEPVIKGIADGHYNPGDAPELLHTQAAGSPHLFFQGEDYDQVTGNAPWQVIDSTTPRATVDASGGKALVSPEDGVTGGDHSTTAKYALVFDEAGTYTMYLRGSMFDDDGDPNVNYGGEDSFYRSSGGSGTAFGTANPGIEENGYGSTSRWMLGELPTEGNYNWWNSPRTYTVDASDVGKAIIFEVDNREGNWSIDGIVFSQESDLRWAQLNALAGLTDKLYYEKFDGDPRSIGYSATGETSSGATGTIWSKFSEAASPTESFTGLNGDYWYGQRMDNGDHTLSLEPLFVESLLEVAGLQLSVDLAAAVGPSGGWESNDYLLIELDKDNDGSFETELARFVGNTGLGHMVLSTDSNVRLAEEFSRFVFDVPTDATEMVLRFTGLSSGPDEAIGFGNIQLIVPEPGSLGLALLGLAGMLGVRRRRRR